MKIQCIAVGTLKENYLKQAVAEYLKRLQAYAQVEVVEVAESPFREKGISQLLYQEGERILKRIQNHSYVIALAIAGKSFSSEAFAKHIQQLTTYGQNHFTLIIGGSFGLSSEVLKRADLHLSFSTMTFPHRLIRIFLLEQIYRACKINRGETYHK